MKIHIEKKAVFLVILLILLYVVFFKIINTSRAKVKVEVVKREALLTECLTAPEGLPSKEALSKLEKKKERLKLKFNSFSSEVFHKQVSLSELPDEPDKRPLYFRKVLYTTTNELLRESYKRKIPIPTTFGFSQELPKEEEVLGLLNKLKLVKEFILLSLENKIDGIIIINSLVRQEIKKEDKPVNIPKEKESLESKEQELESVEQVKVDKTPPKKEDEKEKRLNLASYTFIEEYPILVKFVCSTESLFRLLYRMQGDGDFWLIQNIQIRKDTKSNEKLIVDLLLSGLMEKEPETANLTDKKEKLEFNEI